MSCWFLQFFQKMNQNNSTWGTIVVWTNFVCSFFLGSIEDAKKTFRNWLTFRRYFTVGCFMAKLVSYWLEYHLCLRLHGMKGNSLNGFVLKCKFYAMCITLGWNLSFTFEVLVFNLWNVHSLVISNLEHIPIFFIAVTYFHFSRISQYSWRLASWFQ